MGVAWQKVDVAPEPESHILVFLWWDFAVVVLEYPLEWRMRCVHLEIDSALDAKTEAAAKTEALNIVRARLDKRISDYNKVIGLIDGTFK